MAINSIFYGSAHAPKTALRMGYLMFGMIAATALFVFGVAAFAPNLLIDQSMAERLPNFVCPTQAQVLTLENLWEPDFQTLRLCSFSSTKGPRVVLSKFDRRGSEHIDLTANTSEGKLWLERFRTLFEVAQPYEIAPPAPSNPQVSHSKAL